jgi:hypothetical protein
MQTSTGVDTTDASVTDTRSSVPVSPRKGRPRVAVTTDAVFRLASLQCTQEEAAKYFGCTERTIRRRLAGPMYREAWEMGRARGRISFRRLGLRHASGSGPAAVAAWIHMSKFILGFSERKLGEHPPGGQSPNDSDGARDRLFDRIARIAERSQAGAGPKGHGRVHLTHFDQSAGL